MQRGCVRALSRPPGVFPVIFFFVALAAVQPCPVLCLCLCCANFHVPFCLLPSRLKCWWRTERSQRRGDTRSRPWSRRGGTSAPPSSPALRATSAFSCASQGRSSVVDRCASGYHVEYLDGVGFRSSEVAFFEAKTRRKEQSQGETVASDALLGRWLNCMLLRRAAVAG